MYITQARNYRTPVERIAKYLIKTRDLKLVYGTPDIELMDLEPYGHSDSDLGGFIDDRKSTENPSGPSLSISSICSAQRSAGK